MKFHLAINLERMDGGVSMSDVKKHTIKMVEMADCGGFEIAWAAEHHALEMTIAPNPFQLLTWWAEHTKKIRLGCAVVNAAYWHPIRLAGEAALLDLISDGRLEFGIGSGAYQREFDRMKPGLSKTDGWKYMHEMLPVVKKLWQGDVEHHGEFWQFPRSTSCPKPVQDTVPIWVAARSPTTFDFAIKNKCNVMSWPFTRPFPEVELYKAQLDESIEKFGGDFKPTFALMRHCSVYENNNDRSKSLEAVRGVLGQFENLMRKIGDVQSGFPEKIQLETLEGKDQYNLIDLEQNLMFGSPQEVIEKLKLYQSLGANSFIYYASMGLNMDQQKRSLDLFINKVMPEFT